MAASVSNRICSLMVRKRSALFHALPKSSVRHLSFSFAGPRSLDEILKKELVEDKTKSDLEDIWKNYHEEKVIRMVRSQCCFALGRLLTNVWHYD
jgi:hypothetical protein